MVQSGPAESPYYNQVSRLFLGAVTIYCLDSGSGVFDKYLRVHLSWQTKIQSGKIKRFSCLRYPLLRSIRKNDFCRQMSA
jgi:hypothetical protein